MDKLVYFSQLESKLLEVAIKIKNDEINDLVEQTKNQDQTPLSVKDQQLLKKHFVNKIEFSKKQDTTKWKDWPAKPTAAFKSTDNERKHFKNRQNIKKRKVDKIARQALESGIVVV